LNLVFEHCKGGDLLNYVQSVGRLEETEVRRLCKCIALGLQACHSQGVAHRDLQLSTVLLSEAQDAAKISSFSCSRLLNPGEKLTEPSRHMAYSAPEMLVEQGYNGFAADLWSLGVVLYTLLAGQLPFQACNATEFAKVILKGSFAMPIQASPEAQSLISRLLQPIPKHRISLETVLSHPWFAAEPFLHMTESTDLQALEAIRDAELSASHLLACLQAGEINHLTTAYELMRLHKTYSLGHS
jgi:serine/threonine protein kinase